MVDNKNEYTTETVLPIPLSACSSPRLSVYDMELAEI